MVNSKRCGCCPWFCWHSTSFLCFLERRGDFTPKRDYSKPCAIPVHWSVWGDSPSCGGCCVWRFLHIRVEPLLAAFSGDHGFKWKQEPRGARAQSLHQNCRVCKLTSLLFSPWFWNWTWSVWTLLLSLPRGVIKKGLFPPKTSVLDDSYLM